MRIGANAGDARRSARTFEDVVLDTVNGRQPAVNLALARLHRRCQLRAPARPDRPTRSAQPSTRGHPRRRRTLSISACVFLMLVSTLRLSRSIAVTLPAVAVCHSPQHSVEREKERKNTG